MLPKAESQRTHEHLQNINQVCRVVMMQTLFKSLGNSY